jgi:hypothetical protein
VIFEFAKYFINIRFFKKTKYQAKVKRIFFFDKSQKKLKIPRHSHFFKFDCSM